VEAGSKGPRAVGTHEEKMGRDLSRNWGVDIGPCITYNTVRALDVCDEGSVRLTAGPLSLSL
jgi:hypothetical protein